MLQKRVQFACELLTEQYNHWSLFPIALYIMIFTSGTNDMMKPNVRLWFMCSLFPFALYMIRSSKWKKAFSFVLLHAIVFVLARFIPATNDTERFLCHLMALYYILNSFVLHYKKSRIYSNAISIIITFSLYIIMSILTNGYERASNWHDYYIVSLIVVTMLYFLIHYMQSYLDFLNVNNSSAGYMPVKNMFRSGMSAVSIFTMGCLLLFIISTFFDIFSEIWSKIKNAFNELLKRSVKSTENIPFTNTSLSDGVWNNNPIQWEEEPHFFWIVLQKIFYVIIIVALLIVFVLILVALIRFLHGRFAMKHKKESVDESCIDLHEKIDIDKGHTRNLLKIFDLLIPAERIRFIYKRKILSAASSMLAKDREKMGYYTAAEWEEKLQTHGMSDVYEQARYSAKEMTMEDVKKMKEACQYAK